MHTTSKWSGHVPLCELLCAPCLLLQTHPDAVPTLSMVLPHAVQKQSSRSGAGSKGSSSIQGQQQERVPQRQQQEVQHAQGHAMLQREAVVQ
jgi:hypothetical protein